MTARPVELCPVTGPATRGAHHTTTCRDNHCDGCQPRQAADGMVLCTTHTRRIATDAQQAAQLYDELAHALTTTGQWGQRVAASRTTGLALNDTALAARTHTRHTLIAWTRLIADQRGTTYPGHWHLQHLPPGFIGPPAWIYSIRDDTTGLAGYIAHHHQWLAATDYAVDAATELHELAWGKARRIARPTGTRVVEVCPCPYDCPGTLRAVIRPADQLLPGVLQCSDSEAHCWAADRWREFERYWHTCGILDTATLAARLGFKPWQVRRLVAQGTLTPFMRWAGGRRGRPTMWFRTTDVDTQLATHTVAA